jgi:NDP-sugar pyrophosphorylase family protein
LGADSYRERPLRLIHEPVLLETGGGLKNAEAFFTAENFLVYSGDILTDLPLEFLIEEHLRAGNDVTMALRSTGIATQVALRDGRIVDIGGRHGHTGNYDYANVSVWNRRAFARFSLGTIISFIPVLVDWIGAGGRVGGVVIEDGRWFNLTSPNEYLNVHGTIAKEGWKPAYLAKTEWPVRVAPDATLAEGARVLGFSSVGPGCSIGANAVIEDSILWQGAQITSGARLKHCIVRTRRRVAGEQSDAVI